MIRDFSKYTLSNILVKATSFCVPLILAYFYSESEYGIISLGYAYLNFFSLFFTFGFCESIQRFYYELKQNNKEDIFGNIIVSNLFLVLLFSVLFILLYFFTNIFTELPVNIFLMVIFIGYLKALQSMGLSFLQMEKQSSQYVGISIFSVMLDVFLMIVFVCFVRLPIEYRFISLVFCNSISVVFILIYIKGLVKRPTKILNKKFIQIIKFAFPCMLLPVMSWLLTTSDKIVMSKFETMTNLGIYSFCFSISQIPAIIQQGFITAYTPVFYSEYENVKKIRSIQTLFIKFYALILLVFFLFINVFFKHVKIFEKYENGLVFLPFFILSMFFSSISSMNNLHLTYNYKTKITLLITSVSGVITLVLNFYLIKAYGMLGAAISVMTSMMLQMLLSFLMSYIFGYFAWKSVELLITFCLLVMGLFFSKNYFIICLCILLDMVYIFLSEKKNFDGILLRKKHVEESSK